MLAAWYSIDWYAVLEWVYYVLLLVLLLTGWLLNILGLPGLWLMLLSHVCFGLATGWGNYVGWESVIAIFVLCVLAEIVEFVAGAAGSAKAGGTKRGMIGAIVGGLIGGLVGTGLIPIPVLGTIIGAVAGSFIGAAGIERMIDSDSRRAIDIGIGAAKGRFWGIVIKSGFGVVIGLTSIAAAFPIGGTVSLNATPTTLPTTQPASQPTSMPSTTQAVEQ